MAQNPFVWTGNTGQISTPQQANDARAIAAALANGRSKVASNGWEGLAQLTNAWAERGWRDQAADSEEAGIASAAEALAGITPQSGFSDIAAALSNPWLSQPQSTIAAALLQQNLERQDPRYQLELEQLQMQTDAMRNPVVDPWANTKVINDQIVNWGAQGPQAVADFRSPAGESLVTINNGNTNDFFDGLNQAEGGLYQGFLTGGASAARNLAQIDQLEGLLAGSKTGFEGAAVQLAGEAGIDLGGASGVQAAQALINQMVPAQRQPGSGPMSDADLALFKQSLPRIINQQGGNDLIVETLRQINAYDMELARITQEGISMAEMTDDPQEKARIRRDMRSQINSLQNPITNFKQRIGQSQTGQSMQLPQGVTIRKISD